MRVTFQVEHTTLAQEVKTQAEAFEFMAECASIFSPEPCGCCKATDTHPTAQKFQGKTFRKFACRKCTATVLLMARNDDGGLFFCRTDRDKNPLPNNGWSVYKREGGSKPAERTAQSEDRDPRDQGSDVPF